MDDNNMGEIGLQFVTTMPRILRETFHNVRNVASGLWSTLRFTLQPIPGFTSQFTLLQVGIQSGLCRAKAKDCLSGLTIALLVGILTACSSDNPQTTTLQTTASPSLPTLAIAESKTTGNTASRAIDATWYTYQSPDGKYQVRFPSKPTVETSSLELETGVVQLQMVTYEDDKRGRAYGIVHGNISPAADAPEDINKRLSDSQEGMANAVEAEVETWSAIVQDGYPGREFTLRKPKEFAAEARVVYANGTLYQIVVLAKDENLQSLDVAAFLDSLRLATQP